MRKAEIWSQIEGYQCCAIVLRHPVTRKDSFIYHSQSLNETKRPLCYVCQLFSHYEFYK